LRGRVSELEKELRAALAASEEAEALAIEADDRAKVAENQAREWQQQAESLYHELEAQAIGHQAQLEQNAHDLAEALRLLEEAEAQIRTLTRLRSLTEEEAHQLRAQLDRLSGELRDSRQSRGQLQRQIGDLKYELDEAVRWAGIYGRQRDDAEAALTTVRDGNCLTQFDPGCGHPITMMASPEHRAGENGCPMVYYVEGTGELTTTIPPGLAPKEPK
jgi:chromosome segregation ATPase